jgi:cytosine permease
VTHAEVEHVGTLELESEFEHEPVPPSHRKSTVSIAAVWFGFPMILTCAVFGGIITALLGFQRGVVAILLGNVVLMLYVGALSYLSGESGSTSHSSPAASSGGTATPSPQGSWQRSWSAGSPSRRA